MEMETGTALLPNISAERTGFFWSEAPYLQKPMTQRVGAGLGKSILGPTVEPLGIGSPITGTNYALGTQFAYEHTTSDERLLIDLEAGTLHAHGVPRIAGISHIGASGEPKEKLHGTAPERRNELTVRLKQWKPEEKRQQPAARSEFALLAAVLNDRRCAAPGQRTTLRRTPKLLRNYRDTLNYRRFASPAPDRDPFLYHATGAPSLPTATRPRRDSPSVASLAVRRDVEEAAAAAANAPAGSAPAAEQAEAAKAAEAAVAEAEGTAKGSAEGAEEVVADGAAEVEAMEAGSGEGAPSAQRGSRPHTSSSSLSTAASRSPFTPAAPSRAHGRRTERRVHHNMRLPCTGYEARDASGNLLHPIVPHAWKLALAPTRGSKATMASTRGSKATMASTWALPAGDDRLLFTAGSS